MATEELKQAMVDLGLTVESTFVPFSQSRNRDEKETDYPGRPTSRPQLSLNWRVRLVRDGRTILETDYSAGCAHCPSYKQGDETLMRAEAIEWECENGYSCAWNNGAPYRRLGNRPLKPDPLDVLASLAMDSSVLDESSFEDWAISLGYDSDSRKAESMYRDCLAIALKLRNGLGEDGLAKLRDATQDY